MLAASGDAETDTREGAGRAEAAEQQLGMYRGWGELARQSFWQER